MRKITCDVCITCKRYLSLSQTLSVSSSPLAFRACLERLFGLETFLSLSIERWIRERGRRIVRETERAACRLNWGMTISFAPFVALFGAQPVSGADRVGPGGSRDAPRVYVHFHGAWPASSRRVVGVLFRHTHTNTQISTGVNSVVLSIYIYLERDSIDLLEGGTRLKTPVSTPKI